MTDGDALLAAILASPEDDLPRLVYADWLDEHAATTECEHCKGKGWRVVRTRTAEMGADEYGESGGACSACKGTGTVGNGFAEQAEFIRVQIVCAKYTDCPTRMSDVNRGRPVPLRCGHCEYCLNRRRSEALSHKFSLLPESVPAYGFCLDPTPFDGDMPPSRGIVVSVSRGFVDSVTCSAQTWLAHADELTRTHPIREVQIPEPASAWARVRRPSPRPEEFTDRWPDITFKFPARRAVGSGAVLSRNVGTYDAPIWEEVGPASLSPAEPPTAEERMLQIAHDAGRHAGEQRDAAVMAAIRGIAEPPQ